MSETTKITVATALALHREGQLDQAEAQYRQLWAKSPGQPEILHLMGLLHHQRGRNSQALSLLTKAVSLQPTSNVYQSNLASVALNTGHHDLAAHHAALLLKRDPGHLAGLQTMISSLLHLQRLKPAHDLAQRLIRLAPKSSRSHFLLAQTLSALGRDQEAIDAYRHAIEMEPRDARAHNNLGTLHLVHYRNTDAIACFSAAIAIDPDYTQALNNRGVAYQQVNRLELSLNDFLRVRALDPNYDLILGKIVDVRLKQCDWTHLSDELLALQEQVERGQSSCAPFRLLSLSDDPMLNLKCSQTYAQKKWPQFQQRTTIDLPPPASRIRVGYFSADMHNHATAYLAAEMFEAHDQQRFEVFIFSFGVPKEDAMRKRLREAVEHFVDVHHLGDLPIAELARKHQLDIAVDLKGYTQDARPGIFAQRCAPVQVSYLGYPGSMGLPNMDYLMADPVLIPPAQRGGYSECIAELPHSYQINDSHRPIPTEVPSRESQGLPEDAVVFACFNNNYKIMPHVFQIWMRILKQVPNSVLWLLKDNQWAQVNLLKEAAASGIDAHRIVFAPRTDLSGHLARQPLADLFLDTSPYSAHTTASDALWMGLPVLTMPGRHFASRVCASLLTASGLPELIAKDWSDYERRAVALGCDPDARQVLRAHLLSTRANNPLFDARRTTRAMEDLYQRMHARARQGLAPVVLPSQDRQS